MEKKIHNFNTNTDCLILEQPLAFLFAATKKGFAEFYIYKRVNVNDDDDGDVSAGYTDYVDKKIVYYLLASCILGSFQFFAPSTPFKAWPSQYTIQAGIEPVPLLILILHFFRGSCPRPFNICMYFGIVERTFFVHHFDFLHIYIL